MKDGRAQDPLTDAAGDGAIAQTKPTGLSADEVTARVAMGQNNVGGERTSRTVGEILRANIFTRFNLLLGTLFTAIVTVGQMQDALFGIVLVANALIGIVQELRAKRTLDHLAVLSAPCANVVRDGTEEKVPIDAVARTIPSATIWSPARRLTRSSSTTASIGTFSSVPSRTTLAHGALSTAR